MKVVKLEQNTEEWLEFRKGKSGGSEFGHLYTTGLPTMTAMRSALDKAGVVYPKNAKAGELAELCGDEILAQLKLEAQPKRRYYDMVAERVARPITPNDYVDQLNGQPFSMMARGHILEPAAIELYSQKTGKQVDQDSVVWVSDYDASAYISPDGVITGKYDKAREAIEAKCLESSRIVEAYLTKTWPRDYYGQVLKYFMVNDDLEILHFILYTDVIPGLELQVFDIERDEVKRDINLARQFEIETLRRVEADTKRIENLGF